MAAPTLTSLGTRGRWPASGLATGTRGRWVETGAAAVSVHPPHVAAGAAGSVPQPAGSGQVPTPAGQGRGKTPPGGGDIF